MARKSQWAQFAENFKSTYGLVNEVKQGYDTNQIMDDEKFLAKGGLGYDSKTNKPLEGGALERARYKALGDIATRYGDSEGGLANRMALANLDAVDRENRLNESTFKYQQEIKGLLAKNQLVATTNNLNSDTSLNNAGAAKTNAQTTEIPLNAASQRKVDDANVGGLNAGAAKTNAQTVGVEATNTANKVLLEHQATINTLLASINDTSEGGYAEKNGITTDAQATAHAVKMLEQADMPLDLKKSAISGLNAFTLGGLQEQSAILVAEAEASMQVADPLQGIVDFYDGVNDGQEGDTNSLSVVQTDTGFKIVQTSGTGTNAVSKDLMTADGEDAREVLQAKLLAQIKNPGNMLAISADVLANKQVESNISKTDSETTVLGAQTTALLSEAKVDEAQITKITAEIAKINKDIENSDQTDAEKTRQVGFQKFVGGETYAYLKEQNPELAATLLASYRYNTGMLNMEALKQGGVTLDEYLAMEDVQRQAFNK